MDQIYAMFAEHTNITPSELNQYTIPFIEYLMEGISKNNQTEETPKQISGLDAINELQKRKGF
jgi:succinate dehydrogenase/fumarate reductase flavoprotein subunit